MAEPATNVSAPARAISPMLSVFTPPSTSSQMSFLRATMRRRTSVIFGSTEGMNCWPPKPGFTDIRRTRSSLSRVWSSQLTGVAGFKTRPALQPCSLMSAMVRSTCSEASGWKLMMPAPALANCGTMASTGFTIRCTSSGTETWRLERRAGERADGQVRHVVVIHDIEVNQVGAGALNRAHLVAQPRKIGRQNAGRDAKRHGRAEFTMRAWRRRSSTTSR